MTIDSKDKIVELIKNCNKPDCIDEIWCVFYEYEDIWNEKLEYYYRERIVGEDYIKID
ncbi:hypothetical protein [Clostridium sp. 3-3]|uniref:hypothetical protein n=1 Tax=Clostridium sp. 3-3 TaxID=2070757 RepID=UPI0015E1633A|nr:hypothetical protein [Clostridium sp. 3-3]